MVIVNQRPLPINPILRALTNGVNTSNVRQRFTDAVKSLYISYLNNETDLTNHELECIRDNDLRMIDSISSEFINPIFYGYDDDLELEPNEMTFGIRDYLINIVGGGYNNPLYWVSDNALDVLKTYISNRKTYILSLDTQSTQQLGCFTSILIELIGCLMNEFGRGWLKDWSRDQLQRRTIGDDAEEGEIIIYADDRFTEHMNELHGNNENDE
jgi:hypothetical protein